MNEGNGGGGGENCTYLHNNCNRDDDDDDDDTINWKALWVLNKHLNWQLKFIVGKFGKSILFLMKGLETIRPVLEMLALFLNFQRK